jgi:hypothetical protein
MDPCHLGIPTRTSSLDQTLYFFRPFCRSSIVRQLTEDGSHHLPAYVPEKIKLCKQTTIQDLEQLTLKPKVEGRIIELNPKVHILRVGIVVNQLLFQ